MELELRSAMSKYESLLEALHEMPELFEDLFRDPIRHKRAVIKGMDILLELSIIMKQHPKLQEYWSVDQKVKMLLNPYENSIAVSLCNANDRDNLFDRKLIFF